MHPTSRWFKLSVICALSFFAASHATKRTSGTPKAAACAAPEYRQFDFRAGDWDVFEVGGPIKVARARVDLILDRCVLHEDYQGADGHKGQSFSIFDSNRRVWHQSWVTNRGELLMIEGKFEAGKMVMIGEDRGEWRPENGNVRETAVTSTDGGKTWNPWFDLLFRPPTDAVNLPKLLNPR